MIVDEETIGGYGYDYCRTLSQNGSTYRVYDDLNAVVLYEGDDETEARRVFEGAQQ